MGSNRRSAAINGVDPGITKDGDGSANPVSYDAQQQ
jgi:hypothetical protein